MKGANLMLTFFIIGTVILCVQCATVTDTESLFTNLFTSYSTDIRPPFNQSETLYVSIGCFMFSIFEFDEIEGIISLVASPFLVWSDYRLTWDPTSYDNLSEITVSRTKLWVPSIFIVNPAKKMEAIGNDDFIVRINKDGLISWIPGGIIKSTCSVDMTYFPFDTQTCGIIIAVWGFHPNEVTLLPLSTTVDITYYQANQMWDLASTKMERYALGDYNGIIQIELTLKRKPLYFSLNILAPIILLCMLNPLVFVLPVESGERVSYAVTIFLSFAVFMTLISDTMPKVSEPMSRLSYLIFTSMALSTIICILTILIMRLYYKDDKSEIPKWLKSFYRRFNGGCKLKVPCGEDKRKVQDIEVDNGKHSTTIVKKIDVLEFKKEFGEKKSEPLTDPITWKDIALFVDKTLFIVSIFSVVIFTILTIVLLAA